MRIRGGKNLLIFSWFVTKKIMMKNSKSKFSEYMQNINEFKSFGKFHLIMNPKNISPQSATAQSGQNILHKVHPKIICHLPPCLIGSGLSRGIQCLFKLVWKTLNCVCWSRHKNHLYLLALQRYAAVLEFQTRGIVATVKINYLIVASSNVRY